MINGKEKQMDQIERIIASVGNHKQENELILRELEFIVGQIQVKTQKQKELNERLNTVLHELNNLKEEIKNEKNQCE